jgi:hypothetical protein
VNTILTSLSLADSSIGKGGGLALAETLQLNITLEHVNLSYCALVRDRTAPWSFGDAFFFFQKLDSLIALFIILSCRDDLAL